MEEESEFGRMPRQMYLQDDDRNALNSGLAAALHVAVDWVIFLRWHSPAQKVNALGLPGINFLVCKYPTSVHLFCCGHNQHEFSAEICS